MSLVGVGKVGRTMINLSTVTPEKAAPSTGTTLRTAGNLGSERHRYAIAWPDKLGTDPMVVGSSTRYKLMDVDVESGRNPLSTEMSKMARDGVAQPVSRDQIIRREREQGNTHFPYSADHKQDEQPYPVDPYSAILFDEHAYTHKLFLRSQLFGSNSSTIYIE